MIAHPNVYLAVQEHITWYGALHVINRDHDEPLIQYNCSRANAAEAKDI